MLEGLSLQLMARLSWLWRNVLEVLQSGRDSGGMPWRPLWLRAYVLQQREGMPWPLPGGGDHLLDVDGKPRPGGYEV